MFRFDTAGRIRSRGDDVTLTALNGSIVDAVNDPEADVIGNRIYLDAKGGNIGDPSGGNDLEIDSQNSAPGTVGCTRISLMTIPPGAGFSGTATVIRPCSSMGFPAQSLIAASQDSVYSIPGSNSW